MKRTRLNRGTKPLKHRRVNSVSPKQEQKNLEFHALAAYLVEYRAEWKCELCGGWNELQGHHIIFRRYNIHNAGNCLIACCNCHAHWKWGPGIPIPAEQALILVAKLCKKYSIDPRMTGADVLRMEK